MNWWRGDRASDHSINRSVASIGKLGKRSQLPPLLPRHQQEQGEGCGRAKSGYASSLPKPSSASSCWPVFSQACVVVLEKGQQQEQPLVTCG